MGYAIKELREAQKMTQDELAKKSGVSRQTISALENGSREKVLSSTICAIAEALNTTADKIFNQCVKSM